MLNNYGAGTNPVSPLMGKLYPDFLRLVAQSRRQLSYNGQTIVLEKALNDVFDDTLRRVEVRNDDTEVLPQYLFFERERQALPDLFYRSELPHKTSMELTYQVEQASRCTRRACRCTTGKLTRSLRAISWL